MVARNQLKRLDSSNKTRAENLVYFLGNLDSRKYKTDFITEGNSNYAFTLVLNKPSFADRDLVEKSLKSYGVEVRRGGSGGGNMTRQPATKYLGLNPLDYPFCEHIHHFSWYLGNGPQVTKGKIDNLLRILNSIDI